MNNQIKELEAKNIQVRIYHYRRVFDGYNSDNTKFYSEELLTDIRNQKRQNDIQSKGGRTYCILTFPDGKTFTGEARCSIEDAFVRKRGVAKAVGRAIQAAKQASQGIDLNDVFDKN